MSRTIFWGTFLFMLLGLIGGLVGDYYNPQTWTLCSDFLTALVLIVVIFLFMRKKMRAEMGLLIFLIEALRNFLLEFFVSGFVLQRSEYSYDEAMKLLLVTSIMGSVLGLAVNKKALLIFSVLIVVLQLCFIWLSPETIVFSDLIAINSFIIIGNLMVVYYYRSMLESLVLDLTNSFSVTKSLQENVERMNEENRPFVAFGKNTAGLVHDFRNDVNAVHLNIQTMQLRFSRGFKPSSIELDGIERALANLNDRISKVKFLTNARADRGHELLDIHQLVQSALYPFCISPEIRHTISFETHLEGRVETWGARLQHLQIIENIVRNSCEAIMGENSEGQGKVEVSATCKDRFISFKFTDSGSGIPFCKKRDTNSECTNCSCFAVGKSSKPYGSGYGMVNVIQSVRDLGGTMTIQTGSQGTTIRVVIPQLLEPDVPVLLKQVVT